MAEEVYVELEVAMGVEKFRVDLAPVNMIEETMVKEIAEVVMQTDPIDGIDTVVVKQETKNILHNFVLTGEITQIPNDTLTNAQKKTNLRKLMGIIGNITNTRLKFHYEDDDYYGYMDRLTFTQGSGEDFFGYTIEIGEGDSY